MDYCLGLALDCITRLKFTDKEYKCLNWLQLILCVINYRNIGVNYHNSADNLFMFNFLNVSVMLSCCSKFLFVKLFQLPIEITLN